MAPAKSEKTGSADVVIGIVQRNVDQLLGDEVTAEAKLEDLGVDSLDKIEITIECETEYGITIDDESIEKVQTVGELVALVDKRRGLW